MPLDVLGRTRVTMGGKTSVLMSLVRLLCGAQIAGAFPLPRKGQGSVPVNGNQ